MTAPTVAIRMLNLFWAVGAACGPWLALRSTRFAPIVHAQHVLYGIALCFSAAAVWAWSLRSSVGPAPASEADSRLRVKIPLALLVLIFCATGVEAATGGWLTAYAQRAGDTLGITIGAATCLWMGSLLSRVLHSTTLASGWSERGVLRVGCVGMALAVALLVAWPNGIVTMVAAGMLGFAAGPIYPLVISMALRDREDVRIFIVAGLGSSALPLLTGQISSLMRSLRVGLGVPLGAACVMAALSLTQRSPAEAGLPKLEPPTPCR